MKRHKKNNIRVVIVLSELRPGGMERLVVHLANGLISRKIPVKVVCLQDKGVLSEEIIDSSSVIGIGSKTSMDLKAIWSIGKILKEFRPSHLNIHDYTSLPYTVLASMIFYRCPLIFTAHGLLYEGFEKLQRRYWCFSKYLNGFSAVSEAVALRHRQYLGWKKKIRVVPNGVPNIEKNGVLREKIRLEMGLKKNDILFLAVGNPRPEKGIEDLIQAAIKLKSIDENNSRFKVVVAGRLDDSEYCRMLQDLVEKENIKEFFIFLGFRSDTVALYNAADAFVLSSRSEGLPMVILEAMTARLPVIATRVGGIPDAIGSAGLLVDPRQPEDLAQAMNRLMADPDFRNSLAVKGRDLVRERYSMRKMVDTYLKTYQTFTK